MPARQVRVQDGVPPEALDAYARLVNELEIPVTFGRRAIGEAELLAANPPDFTATHRDRTDMALVTIDPGEAMDLDQAVFIEREGAGYLVHYAIADVGAWVRPGSSIDAEAHRRGQTWYAPHRRYPLHPPALSEKAASLLADGVPRPAMLWRMRLNDAGELVGTSLERALVVNREKLSYREAQDRIDSNRASESLQLLREVGTLRQLIEAERGGISLTLPDQEVSASDDQWRVEYRSNLPVEEWNAQISLLTGIAAARTMLEGRLGVVRTLPPATPSSLAKLRRIARGLRIPWQRGADYASFVRSLDVARPAHLAMMVNCTMLFRGAGYLAFDGEEPDGDVEHAALATPYAHTTAPLRRLVDRYVLEVCHSLLNDIDVPGWARETLPRLPDEMAASDARAKKFERAVIDLTEALELAGRVGEEFWGTVVDVNDGRAVVHINDPAVESIVTGADDLLGRRVRVRLTESDPGTSLVRFEVVRGESAGE